MLQLSSDYWRSVGNTIADSLAASAERRVQSEFNLALVAVQSNNPRIQPARVSGSALPHLHTLGPFTPLFECVFLPSQSITALTQAG